MSTRYIDDLIKTAKHMRQEPARDMEPAVKFEAGMAFNSQVSLLDRYRVELTVGAEYAVHTQVEKQQAEDHLKRLIAAHVYGDVRGRIIKAIGMVIARDRDGAIEALRSISEDLS